LESANWAVRNKEEAIGGSSDCSKKRGTGDRRRRNKCIVSRKQRNGGVCRNRSRRKWKRKRGRSSGSVVDDIGKLK
jgi:hypothetical protein